MLVAIVEVLDDEVVAADRICAAPLTVMPVTEILPEPELPTVMVAVRGLGYLANVWLVSLIGKPTQASCRLSR
jgi:hypothetical protein